MRACWPILLLALAAPVAAAKDPEPPAAARGFVERTRVDFPQQAGPLRLLESKVLEPATQGVMLAYAVDGFPESTFHVFVYPSGSEKPADGVAAALREVEGALRYLGERGDYTDLEIRPVEAFAVVLPADPARSKPADAATESPPSAPATEAGAKGKDAEAMVLQLIAESGLHDRTLDGSRLEATFGAQGASRHSIAYAFFRHLYRVKVRATVIPRDDAGAAFETAADAAVRALVPAIGITSEGACGDISVNVDAGTEAAAEEMMRGILRVQVDNCAGRLGDEPPAAGFRREVLELPADAWKARP